MSDRSGIYEIWTIDDEGTNLRQLTYNSPPNTSFPIWSPDGARLLYRNEGTDNLILDLGKPWDAQTPERLPPPSPGELFVVWDWSPDGRKLCGTLNSAAGTVVSFYSFDTGRYERVADLNGHPSWLPDSRRFVFASEGRAYIADTASKTVRELLARPSRYAAPPSAATDASSTTPCSRPRATSGF